MRLRFGIAVLLFASTAFGSYAEHTATLDAVRAGKVPGAVELLYDGLVRWYTAHPQSCEELMRVALERIDATGRAKRGDLAPLVAKIQEIGRVAGEANSSSHRALKARCDVFRARYKIATGEDGFPMWRAAAIELAEYHDGKAPLARSHAVTILVELAEQEGAPTDEVLAQAREIAGTSDAAPAFWAYRLAEWKRQAAGAGAGALKKELPTALQRLRGIAERANVEKQALVEVHNGAVTWCRSEKKLRMQPEFILDTHDALKLLRFGVPYGEFWSVAKNDRIRQRGPCGRLVRDIHVFAFPAEYPDIGNKTREKDPKKRMRRWEKRANREIPEGKIKRPRAVKINREFRKAFLLEVVDSGKKGLRRRSLSYEWNGKYGARHFTLLIDEYPGSDPKDPELQMFFESLTEIGMKRR
ncbi:MAG: hypothetical protein V3T86_08780 [Planctomycetota bacterium]